MRLRRIGGAPAALALAVALMTLLAWAPGAQAAFPGPNGKIAYAQGGDIYRVNPDGTGSANLTTSFGITESSPTWSPDGNRITFSSYLGSDRDRAAIYVTNAVGEERRRLTPQTTYCAPGGLGWISPAEPAWSPDGTRIVFESTCGGSYDNDLFVVNVDGTGLVQLTNNSLEESGAAWSPDGTKIAFVRRGLGIYTIGPNGTGEAPVVTTTGLNAQFGTPAWSPDGTKIIFDYCPSYCDAADLYTAAATGANLTNLTNTPSDNERNPAWSPDGTKIVLSSCVYDLDYNCINDVFVMNADGSQRALVARGSAGDWQPVGSPPPPAPDLPGKIAFASPRDNYQIGQYDEPEIYVMNADGTAQRRRTANRYDDGSPEWSPDGTRIAFTSRRDGNFEVYVMNADGSGQTRLTDNPAYDGEPTWSPDGKKLAFNTDRESGSSGFQIYVMNADGTGQTPLVTGGYNHSPDWSPNGDRIAFVSTKSGNSDFNMWEILTVAADGSGLTNLTNTPSPADVERGPEWSPDGTKIAYERFVEDGQGGSRAFIWTMNSDGSGATKVPGAWGVQPTWSPDGARIAFPGVDSVTRSTGIFVMNADGSNKVNLTPLYGADSTPDWQAIERPSLTAGPGGSTTATAAMFEFDFPSPASAFQCRLDPGTFEPCESPKSYSNLPDGSHRFEVRTTTPNSTPAFRTWTVDATQPAAHDLQQPANGATVHAALSFSWNETSDATTGLDHYELWIDGSRDQDLDPGSCGGGTCSATLSNVLPDGLHTWQVHAVDSLGNVRESETRSFTVFDPPTATLTATPALALTGEQVFFDASGSTDPNGTIARHQWDLDGDGSFELDTGTSSTTSRTYAGRLDATVKVRITDTGGLIAEAGQHLIVTKVSAQGQFGVTINGGAEITNSRNVQLDVRWPPRAISALVSNDGGFNAPSSFLVDSSIPWTLTSSGPQLLPKTVYVRFTGGESGRETYTDDIVLDETQPSIQSATATPIGAKSSVSASKARARRYRISIRARDGVTGVTGVQVTNNRRKPGKVRGVKKARRFAGRATFKSKGQKIFVRAQDAAGNFSRWRRARIVG